MERDKAVMLCTLRSSIPQNIAVPVNIVASKSQYVSGDAADIRFYGLVLSG